MVTGGSNIDRFSAPGTARHHTLVLRAHAAALPLLKCPISHHTADSERECLADVEQSQVPAVYSYSPPNANLNDIKIHLEPNKIRKEQEVERDEDRRTSPLR